MLCKVQDKICGLLTKDMKKVVYSLNEDTRYLKTIINSNSVNEYVRTIIHYHGGLQKTQGNE